MSTTKQHSSRPTIDPDARDQHVFVGRMLVSPQTYSPTEEEIIAFARQWDPLPWHTDPEAARQSLYGGLTAPGVMIDAMFMKLIHWTVQWPAGALIGMVGAERVRYPKAVRPGDELSLRGEVVSLKRSQSKPDRTVVSVDWQMTRADQQVVYERTNVLLFHSQFCKFDN